VRIVGAKIHNPRYVVQGKTINLVKKWQKEPVYNGGQEGNINQLIYSWVRICLISGMVLYGSIKTINFLKKSYE
jgi:hypothetical protein